MVGGHGEEHTNVQCKDGKSQHKSMPFIMPHFNNYYELTASYIITIFVIFYQLEHILYSISIFYIMMTNVLFILYFVIKPEFLKCN